MVRALQPADPQVIGPYRLVGQLGYGGMGRVFLGMSVGGRPVAVKIIRAELAADPDFRTRFSREVAAARRVNGLFTALVVDADIEAPVPWLATAYVAGPSLAETIDNHGPLTARSAVSLAAGLAEGLNAIHTAGVVHGDLKPSNVLLAEDGPRVIDFGISRAAGAAPLTHPGLVMGSPGFMSPEQAMGRETGPRSDVFSLGAVLAYASTGERPFGTGSAAVRLDRVINGQPDLDKVPEELRALVLRCLEKEMAKRPTAADVLADVGAMHFGTDWLPESILRMFPKDIPFSDAAAHHSTTTLGSNTGVRSDYSGPVGNPDTDDWPRYGDRSGSDGSHARDQGDWAGEARSGADSDDRPAGDGDEPGEADRRKSGDRRQAVNGRGQQTRLLAEEPTRSAGLAHPDDLETQDGDQVPRVPLWRLTAAACLVLVLLTASGAAGYFLIGAVRHPASVTPQPATSPTLTGSPLATGGSTPGTASPSAGTAAGEPAITGSSTYQQGSNVFIVVRYSDPGHDATGFGFTGTDGSSLAEQDHTFVQPGDGVVTANSVTYPVEQCGATRDSSSSVKVWITYSSGARSGARSNPVTVHLACDS
jgi:serine/threonine protein kinase